MTKAAVASIDHAPSSVAVSRPTTNRFERYAWLGLIVVVVLLCARTIGYGYHLDDVVLLRPWSMRQVLDGFVGEFDRLQFNDPYFRPLVGVVFGLEWKLWGTHLWGYHLVNIALHAGVTVMLYALMRRLGVAWWAAFAGATLFAATPSNAATVVYLAERQDSMAALFVLGGLLCLERYHAYRRIGALAGAVACLFGALGSKEIGIALVPMAAVLWWHLRVMARVAVPADDATGPVGHWRAEIGRYLRVFADRSEWAGALPAIGPLVFVAVAYLPYRAAVLTRESFGNRFAETSSPVKGFAQGVKGTLFGVPWGVKALAVYVLVALVVLAFVLRPRHAAWRTALLGLGLVACGVLPLSFTGGTEPRLLYVAQLGVAVLVAAVATVLVSLVTPWRRTPTTLGLAVVAGGLAVAFAGATLVTLVRAQDQYAPGTASRIAALVELKSRLTPDQLRQIPTAWIEQMDRELAEAGATP